MNVGELKKELEKHGDHIEIYIDDVPFEHIDEVTDIGTDETRTITKLFFKGGIQRDWFFSFGVGHTPFHKSYVRIYGTFSEARSKMFSLFGRKWCMQYDNLEDLHPEKWGLTELSIEDMTDINKLILNNNTGE